MKSQENSVKFSYFLFYSSMNGYKDMNNYIKVATDRIAKKLLCFTHDLDTKHQR